VLASFIAWVSCEQTVICLRYPASISPRRPTSFPLFLLFQLGSFSQSVSHNRYLDPFRPFFTIHLLCERAESATPIAPTRPPRSYMSPNESSILENELSDSTTDGTESLASDEEFVYFEYQALDQANDEIRLLKIDTPTVDDDLICGSLETYSLKDCPAFRALSYEWGRGEEDPLHLVVNGDIMETSRRLMLFMECYCDVVNSIGTEANEYIWIDQICIDQQNTTEKNQQVQIMSEIYSKAMGVIAWFGPDHDEILDYLSSDDFHEWCTSPALHLGYLPAPLERFLALSFWTRLWIQQELVLAKEVIFMSGTTWIYAEEMAEAQGNSRIKGEAALLSAISKIGRRRSSSLRFYDAITKFSRKICADPRDKVYGIQAMLPTDDRVQIDYQLKKEEVYEQAVGIYIDRPLSSNPVLGLLAEDIYNPIIALGIGMGLEVQEAMGIYERLYVTWMISLPRSSASI